VVALLFGIFGSEMVAGRTAPVHLLARCSAGRLLFFFCRRDELIAVSGLFFVLTLLTPAHSRAAMSAVAAAAWGLTVTMATGQHGGDLLQEAGPQP
jgi:hypothetical protein